MEREEFIRKFEALRPVWHSFKVYDFQTTRDDRMGKESITYPENNWVMSLPYMPELKDRYVLDIGCNAGYFSIMAAKAGAIVTGVDTEQDGLKSIEQANLMSEVLLDPIQRQRTNFLKKDFFDLPESEVYDVIFFYGVYYHLADHKAALRKIRRLLRPGGELFMETAVEEKARYLPPNHGGDKSNVFVPSTDYVLNELKDNGFAYLDGWSQNRKLAGHRQMFHAKKI